MKNKISKIIVDLGSRTYPIYIGNDILSDHISIIKPYIEKKQLIIITDENIKRIYMKDIMLKFKQITKKLNLISIPFGEKTKSFEFYESICERILQLNIDRNVVIAAIGGGVIGDLAGFVASTILRGVDYLQIPTTLLSQVDSSVGGKTGINTRFGKNLIGTFYQPKLVIIDIKFLRTLPLRELKSGYAEILKYSLISDLIFFEWLEKNCNKILDPMNEEILYAIEKSCYIKARIVSSDEREQNNRALLNLGHTFAHAIEAETNFDGSILHGEAVSVGLSLAFSFSILEGKSNGQELERLKFHLKKLDMPYSFKCLPLKNANANDILSHMKKDKKNSSGRITLILINKIGDAFVKKNIYQSRLHKFLEKQL